MLERLAALEGAGDREGILHTFLIEVAGNDEEDYELVRGRPVWPLMVDNALTLPSELRAVQGYRFDPAAVAGVAAPTLCLVGEVSGPELWEAASRVAAALPRARVQVLPRQGHGAMFSAPELFASEVERFLLAEAA